MLEILTITGPVYLLMGLGYLCTQKGLFSKSDMRVFGRFVLYIALPAMLFTSLSHQRTADILNGSYLLAYLAGSLLALGLGYGLSRRWGRLSRLRSTIVAMGMSCSNSGFVGYPIVLLTLAPVAGLALALNMVIENVVIIPILLIMVECFSSDAQSWQHTLKRALKGLATNPLVLSLLAGIAASLLEWQPPAALGRSINLLSQASSALSLFVIGGTLTNLPLKGLLSKVSPVLIGKLVLHPAAVLLAMISLPWLGLPDLGSSLKGAGVLLAAAPMMSIYPILAQGHGMEEFSATALLGATVLSFFSISAVLLLLPHLPL
jgi:predicted permease